MSAFDPKWTKRGSDVLSYWRNTLVSPAGNIDDEAIVIAVIAKGTP
jgi:hypothetical protein